MHDLKWQGISSAPQGHEHFWVSTYNVPPVRIFNCACGERRQVTTHADGSEKDEIITKPGGSFCNLLPLQAMGSDISAEDVLAAQK